MATPCAHQGRGRSHELVGMAQPQDCLLPCGCCMVLGIEHIWLAKPAGGPRPQYGVALHLAHSGGMCISAPPR